MGWGNPIVAGVELIRTAIQSLNFVANSAGWQIQNNGNAQFNSVTLTGTFGGNYFQLNSSGFFLYSSTPAFGNLIFAAASAAGFDAHGNQYYEGAWSSNGAGQGVLLAGIQLEMTGSQAFNPGGSTVGNGALYATPAASKALQSGMDVIGPGDYQQQPVIQMLGQNFNQTLPPSITLLTYNSATQTFSGLPLTLQGISAPSAPASGLALAWLTSGLGQLNLTSGTDGNTWATGHWHAVTSGTPQVINATGFTEVTPLGLTLEPGSYKITVHLIYEELAAAGIPQFRFAGTASGTVESFTINGGRNIAAAGATSVSWANIWSATGFPSNTLNGLTMAANGNLLLAELVLEITVTAAGTVQFQAATTVAADTFNIQNGTSMDVWPTQGS